MCSLHRALWHIMNMHGQGEHALLATNVFTSHGLQQGLHVLGGSMCDNLPAWHYRDMLATNSRAI